MCEAWIYDDSIEWKRHVLCCIAIDSMNSDGPVNRWEALRRPATPVETHGLDSMEERLRQEKIRRWKERWDPGHDTAEDDPSRGSRGRGTLGDPLGPPWDEPGQT